MMAHTSGYASACFDPWESFGACKRRSVPPPMDQSRPMHWMPLVECWQRLPQA